MSEETMTPEQGSGDLTVRGAVSAFEGILSAGEDSPEQPETVDQEVEESVEEEVSEGEEEVVTEDTESQEEVDFSEDEPEEESYEDVATYKVKASGEEKEVTIDELIKNYQLGADYTKKTQEIAEQRKAIEEGIKEVQESKQVRDLYSQRLQAVEEFLQKQVTDATPQDLAELKENDPVGYAVKIAEITEKKENLSAVQQERAKIAQQQQLDQKRFLQQKVVEEAQKLSQILPEFSDPNKGEQLRNEIRAYGKSVGFTDAEMSNVIDHRHVLMLRKAQLYDQLQKNKPNVTKKVNSAPKMVKSGNKVDPSNRDVRKKNMAKLKQSGKVRDAVALFENFI
jgi:hypothetical protein